MKLTKSEIECEKQFCHGIKRSPDGKFVVNLPMKMSPVILGNSMFQAEQRFYGLERKLEKNKKLKEEYTEFINDYIKLGHMEELRDLSKLKQCYYFPHHCVLKPDSTTTKLRVVFDGSCKTTSNKSLNDVLHTGAKLQENLFNILLRFRKHRFAVTADIEKMYRQIWVAEKDQNYQLIFWRWNPNEPLKTFKLKTVTYGTSCAPYLAVRCLFEIAEREYKNYPKIADRIKNDFYMDDLMTGGDNMEDIQEQLQDIYRILKNYGFHLRKWCTNEENILRKIENESRESKFNVIVENSNQVKALGVTWQSKEDEFIVQYNWEGDKKLTKRTILSDIARLFDPLGFINPIVVRAKILMQELWKEKVGWDEKLPYELQNTWLKIRNELPRLNGYKIRRRIKCDNPTKIEIHGFCDASMKAYGAVVYLKTIDAQNKSYISLLASKSRVAPTKSQTLPRLELCAAVLLVDLVQVTLESLKMEINEIWYYSDSEIVLKWLQLDAAKLQVFVSNRVSHIQSKIDVKTFCHVATQENPADLVSRGVSVEEIINNKLWFEGPKFLKEYNFKSKMNEKIS